MHTPITARRLVERAPWRVYTWLRPPFSMSTRASCSSLRAWMTSRKRSTDSVADGVPYAALCTAAIDLAISRAEKPSHSSAAQSRSASVRPSVLMGSTCTLRPAMAYLSRYHSPWRRSAPAPPSSVPAARMYFFRYRSNRRWRSRTPGIGNSTTSSMRSRTAASRSPGRLVARTTTKSRDWSPVRYSIALRAPRRPSLMPSFRRPRNASASSMKSSRPDGVASAQSKISCSWVTAPPPRGATSPPERMA
mmetsp:Transcript_36124/g.93829  ORF Transcript_36124/g.93829 Transcript_36124/m.93829 type:complete len:249 (+) Transcript_36124:214-960(+)